MQPAGPMCPAHPPATTEQPKPSQKTHVVFFSFCWSARSNAIDSRLCALLLSFLPAFCLRHLLYYFLQLLPPNLYCIYIKVRVQNLFGHRLQEVLRADVPSSSTWSWGGVAAETVDCFRLQLSVDIHCILLSIAQLFFFRYIAWCVLLSSSKRKKTNGMDCNAKEGSPLFSIRYGSLAWTQVSLD